MGGIQPEENNHHFSFCQYSLCSGLFYLSHIKIDPEQKRHSFHQNGMPMLELLT